MSSFALLVPVYNEAKTVGSVLEKLEKLDHVDEIVIVNDGSKDGTDGVLRSLLERGGGKFRVVTHPVNRGKGAAIRSGIAAARSEFLAIQDADTEYDFGDLTAIYAELKKGSAPVVYGSRFLKPNPTLYWTYLLGNKVLTALANILAGGSLTDSYTCYKGMALDRWRRLDLQSDGFEIEAEITVKCLKAGWKILETPISYHPRSFSEGKKIRSTDAIKGAITMFRYALMSGSNRDR